MLHARFRGARLSALLVALFVAISSSGGIAFADGGRGLTPRQLPSQWDLHAQVVIPIVLLVWAYGAGVRALWRRAGVGRGIAQWRVAAFALGVFTIMVAVVSPLDAASGALFSAHMAQHALLMLVAAPLLILGEPGIAFAWALPLDILASVHVVQRHRLWARAAAFLTHPMIVWVLFALAFWIWHVPSIYDAAVRSDALHAFEHASLLGVSLLFWWTLLRAAGRRRFEYGAAIVFTFTSMLQMMIVPALLTFSSTTWYPYYAHVDPQWHLTPLQDQALAGLIMWMPSNVVFLVAGAYLVWRYLQADERRASAGPDQLRRSRAEIDKPRLNPDGSP